MSSRINNSISVRCSYFMPRSIRKLALPAAAALLMVDDVISLLLIMCPSDSVCICLLILDAGASSTKEEAARYNRSR
jgi:hypothetical protein